MGIWFDVASATPLGNLVAPVEDIGLAYFTLSLLLNVILTGMIVYRIWRHHRDMKKAFGGEVTYHSPFTSVTTMFVESAALYTMFLIPLLVTFALASPYSQIFLGVSPSVQVRISYGTGGNANGSRYR